MSKIRKVYMLVYDGTDLVDIAYSKGKAKLMVKHEYPYCDIIEGYMEINDNKKTNKAADDELPF